jgi:hypothetical protein
MSILLNDAELAALSGLPLAAVCLYVMAIRPRMDLGTGMVGVRYLVSWQAMREALYVEPAQGRTESGSPHESTLRRLSSQLEKAGLIKNSSNSSNRQLIFKCLLATHDKSVENKPDRHPDRQADRPAKASKQVKTGETVRASKKADRQPDRHPDTHPSFSSLVLKESSSVSEKQTDDDSQSETSKHKTTPLHLEVGSDELRRSAFKMVKDLSDKDAQRVLDQFAGAIRKGGVRFPLRYLNSTISSFEHGEFTGELADQEAALRKRRQTEQAERDKAKDKPVLQRNHAAAQAAFAKIKAMKGQGART